MKTLLFITILSAIITKGCNSNNDDPQNLPIADGLYSGIFTSTSSTGVSKGDVTLEIKGNRFIASGNANRIPAGGSGTWSVDPDGKAISLQDENFWTADFDWSLIMSGDFSYSFNGSKLILTRSSIDGSTSQEYELNKINQ